MSDDLLDVLRSAPDADAGWSTVSELLDRLGWSPNVHSRQKVIHKLKAELKAGRAETGRVIRLRYDGYPTPVPAWRAVKDAPQR